MGNSCHRSRRDESVSQPPPHPLMEKFPANAQDYLGKVLTDRAYLVIIHNEPFEVCGNFHEAIAILADELDESEMVVNAGAAMGVYYREGGGSSGNSHPTGWISVVSLDVIDELGLLYLP